MLVDVSPETANHYNKVGTIIRSVHGIIVIPHPCTPFFSMKRKIITQVRPNAIEVLNAHSPWHSWDNLRSLQLANQLNIPKVAGSDSHTWQTVGDAYTLIDAAPNVDSIIEAISKGRASVNPVRSSNRCISHSAGNVSYATADDAS